MTQRFETNYASGAAAADLAPEMDGRRGLALPTRGALRTFLIYSVMIDIAFLTIYGGMNWYTASYAEPYRLYFDWELAIPFVPQAILIYLSMFVLFFVPLFQLSERELARLGGQVLLGTFIAGVTFFLVPAELGFPRTGDAQGLDGIFGLLYLVDQPYNLIPSLHIVFSALIVFSLLDVASPPARIIFGTWLVLLTLSVFLVHQHHVADVAAAYGVAFLCRRVLPASTSMTAPFHSQ